MEKKYGWSTVTSQVQIQDCFPVGLVPIWGVIIVVISTNHLCYCQHYLLLLVPVATPFKTTTPSSTTKVDTAYTSQAIMKAIRPSLTPESIY